MDTRQEKLQGIINDGSRKVGLVLNDIHTEFAIRKDIIVKPEAFDFDINGGVGVRVKGEPERFTFTGFSKNQLLSRAGVPVAYAEKLQTLGENELLLNNLNIMTKRNCSDGLLMRRIKNTVKGVLSPAYRRMDASPIFEGFVSSALSSGYVPYSGSVTDYRYNVSFILPEVFQPSENEFLVLGVSITTSDYGSSALQIELLALRITCLNLCMGTDVMRSIHIGKRFDTTQDLIQLSNQTHDLDNKAVASAVGDAVKSSIDLQVGVKDRIISAMDTDSGTGVNIVEEVKKLRQKGFKKELAESVKNTYEAELPVELLPVGQNKWRLSNAISLIANGSGLALDVKLDLQKQAMAIL